MRVRGRPGLDLRQLTSDAFTGPTRDQRYRAPACRPPHDGKYHLSEDLADKAIVWLRKHRAYTPDKPFLMYWAPGAAHGPHHVFNEWADKYKGKFDDGWDTLRERTFKRQKELGWIPADAKLTARAATMASWDSIPQSERAFQRRLMEVFAGFVEHVDTQAGRVIGELDRLGIRITPAVSNPKCNRAA